MTLTTLPFLPMTLAAMLFPAWAAGQQPAAAPAQRPGPPSGLAQEVDAYVEPYVKMNTFSGMVLIAKDGKIELERGYGMANYELAVPSGRQTRYHIASMSKPFTAAAVLLLQEEGKLKVSDPLSRFIPDFPRGDSITLHHLLTHTSGIHNINDLPDYDAWSRFPQKLEAIIARFKDLPLDFAPGAKYSYSNSNYNLLAYVIEKASGQKYGEFITNRILRPLRMDSSGVDDDPSVLIPERADGYLPWGADSLAKAPYLDWSIKTGNGSIYSTAEDLLKLDQALYSDRLLSAASRKQMFAAQFEDRIGYGWFLGKRNGKKVARINGRSPGFTAEMHRYVDDKVTIIVLSNNYSSASQSMIADLGAIYFRLPYQRSKPLDRRVAKPGELARYAGRYRFGQEFYVPNGEYQIEDRGDHLAMVYDPGNVYALVPLTSGAFFQRTFGGEVRFITGPGGEITKLTWETDGRTFEAAKISNGHLP